MVVLVICDLVIGGLMGSAVTLGVLAIAEKYKQRKERHEKIIKLLEEISKGKETDEQKKS